MDCIGQTRVLCIGTHTVSSDFPLVAFFLGDEAVGRKKAEESLVKQVFGDARLQSCDITAADGAERAVEVARTVPMMAKNRVVIVRNMESAGVQLLDDLLSHGAAQPFDRTHSQWAKHPAAVGGVDRGETRAR